MKKILVTGSAGFIGYHLTKQLLKRNYKVVGIDSLNTYYDRNLKISRNKDLKLYAKKNKKKFYFYKLNITNRRLISDLFYKYKFYKVFHMAAQPGVRYSFEEPYKYIESNLVGFFNILQNCKRFNVKKFIFASSSSVYGAEKKIPYIENHSKTKPIQLYAATKLSNEILASTYSRIFNMKIIGLRFFTVYGPWGRPDMALFKFMKKIFQNKAIDLYNQGNHLRDFTYIDDIVNGIILSANYNKKNFEIFNLGKGKPIKTINFVKELSKVLQKKIKINYIKKQKGDMDKTYCSTIKAKKYLKFKCNISLDKGVLKFYKWYKEFYKI
tara:strand:- start:280 stop:1254 length:975 start_codon:yes stop_codon:yes gene_type:complete